MTKDNLEKALQAHKANHATLTQQILGLEQELIQRRASAYALSGAIQAVQALLDEEAKASVVPVEVLPDVVVGGAK